MKHRIRTAPLALALLLGLSLLSPAAQARETDFFNQFPESVPVEARRWRDAETASGEFYELREELLKSVQDGAVEDSLLNQLLLLGEQEELLSNEYTFCYLDYCRDPEAYAEDYLAWSGVINRVQNDYLSALQTVLRSENGAGLASPEEAEAILSMETDSEEQLAMLEQESTLVNDYWMVINGSYADYQVEVDGTTWTLEKLAADDDVDDATYLAVIDALVQAKCAEAAQILVELVPLRNRYAASKGYDSYADYAYETLYGRDYTPEDAAALCAAVKETVVPLERELTLPILYNPSLSENLLSGLEDMTQAEMLDAVEPYMEEISSEYAELFAYMRENDLVDIGPLDTKQSVGFTIELPLFHSAYLFNAPYGTYQDVETLIHEFGHYADFCLAPDDISSYDVSEIHSQGLEVLGLHFADGLAGAEGGDAYRANVLYQLVTAVTEGCLYDEFQQAVYADGDMTAEEMGLLFRELSEEYGYQYADDESPEYSWALVSHTFESPYYYISYATSALSALELLDRSAEDFEGAADTYLSLVAQTDAEGYRAALRAAGLSDVFAPGVVETIAAGVEDYARAEIYDLPAFADLENHWGAEDALLCAACGLFQGDASGNFLPEASMTRGALVTTLWRLCGSPGPVPGAVFTDVAPDAWYADAVSWAAAAGVTSGTEDRLFSPEGTVTREQLAVMLYRLAGSPDVGDAADILSGFADTAELSPWAVDGMAWAVEVGLITGKPGSLLDPDGVTSRAEAAAMLARCL